MPYNRVLESGAYSFIADVIKSIFGIKELQLERKAKKEEEKMTTEQITAVITIIVTYICGKLAKKFNWVTKDYIPVQNMVIGFFAGLVSYMAGITNNPITSICVCILSAFATGGAYDLGKCGEEIDK